MVWHVAAARSWHAIDVDEQALVWIARVVGEHTVVDVFLGALAVVAGSKGTAGGIREQTGLHSGGLGIIMDIVDNDSPLASYVLGSFGHGVDDVTGAGVALGARPVGDIVRVMTRRCACVKGIVKMFLLVVGYVLD